LLQKKNLNSSVFLGVTLVQDRGFGFEGFADLGTFCKAPPRLGEMTPRQAIASNLL